jgi:hypothetical protein
MPGENMPQNSKPRLILSQIWIVLQNQPMQPSVLGPDPLQVFKFLPGSTRFAGRRIQSVRSLIGK